MPQMEEVEIVVAARGSMRRVRSRLDRRDVSVARYKLESSERFEGR